MLPLLVKDGLSLAVLPSVVLFYIMSDILIDQLHLVESITLAPSTTEVPVSRKHGRTIRAVVQNATIHKISLYSDSKLIILASDYIFGLI